VNGVGVSRARRDADIFLRAACRAARNSVAALREAGEPEIAERVLRYAVELESQVAALAATSEVDLTPRRG